MRPNLHFFRLPNKVSRTMSSSGAAVIAAFACLNGQAAAAEPDAAKTPTKAFEVKAIRDVAYYDAADADKVKHKLDLFLPKDQKDFPVVLFVHGGAWRHGDKNYFGVYSALGSMFARNGIGAVITNYRLSPEVMHPEHIKDVARAFAWTHKNIEKYGGRPDQIFVCGHSAGAHLVALLATDESYLKAEGLGLKDIKGVLPLSGVYSLPEKFSLALPFAGPKSKVETEPATMMVDRLFDSVFGKDKEKRKEAFPIAHVKKGLPPFLILYADSDLPDFEKNAEEFAKVLKEKDVKVETMQVAKRNHLSLIIDAADDDDPTAIALRRFIDKQRQVKKDGK
ncbi:MAG TPA: alpha/beta hydrolase [Gemmataceae bacterium]